MTYQVGDDATIIFPVTDTAVPPGTLSFIPTVSARRVLGETTTLTGTWLGSPGPQRDLEIPLGNLPAGLWELTLVIDGGEDVTLGWVNIASPVYSPTDPGEPSGPVAWSEITGKPSTFPPAAHTHDDRYYTQAEVDALFDGIDPTQGASVDHGAVGSTLTITEAGSHELDLSGDLAVTVSIEGDVTLFVHGTGTVTVAGQEFEVDGDEVILIVTSPRGAQSAYMVGATTPAPEPVEDPPTQPGAITVTPTGEGFDLSWVASTVAAGYEGALDGGTYVDYGPNLTESITGLSPGSEHSGTIRAYNSAGQRSTARAWGPATVASVGLHEQLLALEPTYYLRTSRGSIEDFGSVNANAIAFGGMVFTGPALIDGETGSAAISSIGGDKNMAIYGQTAFINATSMTIVALVRPTGSLNNIVNAQPFAQTAASITSPEGYFNEYGKAGSTYLFGAMMDTSSGPSKRQWRNGVSVNIDAQGGLNAGAGTNDGVVWIGKSPFSGASNFYLSHLAIFVDTILDDATMQALAVAAGTWGQGA